jgi:hypothetical protein
MAYVYEHVRLDTNKVFYIGIGSDNLNYSRAKATASRNAFWYRIIKKTNYTINILFDDLSWEDACKKEIELIKLYGRYKDGGILVNLTEGGEGFKKNHTDESKKQISNSLSNKRYEDIHGVDNAEEEKLKRKNGVKKYWDNLTDEERNIRVKVNEGKRYNQKNKEIYTNCIYCGLSARASNLKRWHNENCKYKNI